MKEMTSQKMKQTHGGISAECGLYLIGSVPVFIVAAGAFGLFGLGLAAGFLLTKAPC